MIRAKQEQKQKKNYFKNALTQVQIFRLEVLTCGAATRAAAAYIFSSQLYLFPRLLLQICTRGSQQARAWRKASLPFWHLTATCTQSQRAKEMLFFYFLRSHICSSVLFQFFLRLLCFVLFFFSYVLSLVYTFIVFFRLFWFLSFLVLPFLILERFEEEKIIWQGNHYLLQVWQYSKTKQMITIRQICSF